MTTDARPEVQRIARLLRVRPDQLGFLDDVDDADLIAFRGQLTSTLFDANAGVLTRLGSAAKLLPSPVLAKIAERVFGPLLCARVAGAMDPSKASEVAARLPVNFLTDVAVELDPRQVEQVVRALPNDMIVDVARVLGQREDWITLGQFVGFLGADHLTAAVDALDDTQLLRTAYTVDDVSAIPGVVDVVGTERLTALFTTAAREDLFDALLRLATHLRDDQIDSLADAIMAAERGTLGRLVTAAATCRHWDALLPIAASLPADAKAGIAESVGDLSPEVRADIMAQATSLGVYDDLGPIADALAERAA
ncbi:hypothetical protein [Haloechinothrix salitolerans]|uniref:MgtE intracellular N domain-containing protein n=1 Tax=Haloechinothrix salitolerans TaxID=926830 RepID=A0ABW2C7M0_9PSEU